MRAVLLAALTAITLGLAGCGSDDVTGGGASAAEVLRAGALVYWETEADPDSDQWKQTEELIRRFPDGGKWLAELEQELESDSELTWQEDIEPSLGGQLVIAVYARSLQQVNFVGLINPDDVDKAIDVIERANEEEESPEDRLVHRRAGDWIVVSDREASIDAALKGDEAGLADDDGFKAAMEELPDDSLTRVYFDAAAALETFGEVDPEANRQLRALGLDKLDFGGAWARAKDDGAELAFTLRGDGAERLLGTGETYASKLIDRVPGDAFAFYSFRGEPAKEQFDQFRDNPLYSMGLRQFERELGVKLEDLVALFQGEVVFYARRGAPIPELTLLLEAADPAQGRQAADRLLRTLAEKAGGEVTEDGDVTTGTFEGFSVNVGTVEGAVVVSTAKDAFDGDAGETLSDNDGYTEALEAAGAPDEYTGLAWIDLEEAVRLALGLAGTSGETIPPEIERNLEPLQSLVAYGERDGNIVSSLVFVGIE